MEPEAYYSIHKTLLSLFPIMSQMNPVHTLTVYFSKIHCDILPLYLCLQSGLFPSDLPKILHVFLTVMHGTCPAYLILN